MIFFWLALVGTLTAWWVSVPLWRAAARDAVGQSPSRGSAQQPLRERRDTLLRHLKELEFDRSMEKIEADDYTRLRASVSAEAATVLRELEEAESARRTFGLSAPRSVPGQLMSLDIETEILIARARRKHHRGPHGDINGASNANGFASSDAQANGNVVHSNGVMDAAAPAVWHCSSCGRGMGQNDQFCASCGTRRNTK